MSTLDLNHKQNTGVTRHLFIIRKSKQKQEHFSKALAIFFFPKIFFLTVFCFFGLRESFAGVIVVVFD